MLYALKVAGALELTLCINKERELSLLCTTLQKYHLKFMNGTMSGILSDPDQIAYILGQYYMVIPTIPCLPPAGPENNIFDLFPPKPTPYGVRFVNREDPTSFMICTGGACLGIDQNKAAGCSLIFDSSKFRCFRLENRGPTGIAHPHTSDRAELRAIIAALQFRAWSREGFKRLIIGTSSLYVFERVEECENTGRAIWETTGPYSAAARNQDLWVRTGPNPNTVPDQDLWILLLAEICNVKENDGVDVWFWWIPGHNEMAEQAAIEGTRMEALDHFCIVS